MPQQVGEMPDIFNSIKYTINDNITHGIKPKKVNNTLNKIVGEQMMIYWYEINNEIALAAELHIKQESLVVSLLGKNPVFKNKPPYASDLYSAIAQDNSKSLRFTSDTVLTDEGSKVWKKLYQLGNKISVYDDDFPGQTFKTIDNEQEMDQFLSDDPAHRRYQFILSKPGAVLAETRAFFQLRRFRELTPSQPLND